MFDNEWDVEGWLDSAMFPTRILKSKVQVSADRRWETELGNRVGKQSWEIELGNGAVKTERIRVPYRSILR
jgi:hypothetical protein